MRVRVLRAAGMAEAMARLRAELGPEAVILDSRRVRGGVELTAALERLAEPLPEEPVATPAAAPAASPDARVQPRHNLPPALAARLAGGDLAARLAAALPFAPLPDGLARPLLLAGPPGAGKTLSCAKLATRAVLGGAELGGPGPLLVGTDAARAGATEQLAAFARLLGLRLAVAAEPVLLARAVQRCGPGQAVLIDSAGCDPFAPAAAARLRALALAADAEIVVVLPAGLDPGEAAETAAAFVALGARHLLPTRLDGARRLGGVLAAAAAGLALGMAGTGPGVADGLTPIDPGWLARRLAAPFFVESGT